MMSFSFATFSASKNGAATKPVRSSRFFSKAPLPVK